MRVALIDDAAIARALVARIVAELGHELVAPSAFASIGASLATEALAELAATEPDLVVIDGRFGDPLGTQPEASANIAAMIRVVRSVRPTAAIGIIAALGETSLVRAASDAGAGFVVPRPILTSHLRATFVAIARERMAIAPDHSHG